MLTLIATAKTGALVYGVLLTLAAFAVGYILGPGRMRGRVTLGLITTARNIGAAATVALVFTSTGDVVLTLALFLIAHTGFVAGKPDEALGSGTVRISTSKDPVGAPIYYRDVPLMPGVGKDGVFAWTDYFASDPAAAASFLAFSAALTASENRWPDAYAAARVSR